MASPRPRKQPVEFSPGTQGSSDMGSSRLLKCEKTRRSWSPREEEILLVSLKDLVVHGWKSDNSFRAGFMNKLEESLRKENPKIDIRVNPHIMSKITSWKKNYYSLQSILSRSGVGFNLKGNYMIDCDNEQWEQIVMEDGNAQGIRNKLWPYWDDWQDIFGKDRANGGNAEDILEAVNDLYAIEKCSDDVGGGYNYVNSFEDVFLKEATMDENGADAAENSICQTQNEKPIGKRPNKKRKASTSSDGIVELLSKIHADTNARLESISARIGYEFDFSNARKEVYGILGRIPALSLDNKFDACAIVVSSPDRLDMFMSLPEEDRGAYVKRLLRDKRNN